MVRHSQENSSEEGPIAGRGQQNGCGLDAIDTAHVEALETQYDVISSALERILAYIERNQAT